eukprot:g59462.t1
MAFLDGVDNSVGLTHDGMFKAPKMTLCNKCMFYYKGKKQYAACPDCGSDVSYYAVGYGKKPDGEEDICFTWHVLTDLSHLGMSSEELAVLILSIDLGSVFNIQMLSTSTEVLLPVLLVLTNMILVEKMITLF